MTNFQLLSFGACCVFGVSVVGLFSSLLFGFSDFSQLINVVVLVAVNPVAPTINDFIDYNEYIKLIVPFDNDM
ncbi:hypothetical protein [Spiroplasma phoeniceum]|uniref:Uncharacterized protein n=1 Tax=Spiroplasma phoeniceum P40 TaxID=1276259 RepID=A0A345DR63_9MOLU|nr:hypothetical protein [Spiroplasma phoeniceum]AXF96704.1 hypothetical protein SDAV_001751 [Spiroplasma phoeniceum P40]